MKLLATTLFLLVFCPVFGQQFNPGSASTETIIANPSSSIQVNDVECTENIFWTLDAPGNIYSWQISSGAITFMDTVMLNTPINSIAFSGAMNLSTIANTFYGSDGHDLMYYDGVNWNTLNVAHGNAWIGNCSGFQNYLYYTAIAVSGNPNRIVKFDGTNATTIVTLPSGRDFTTADLAVDENGDMYIMTGINTTSDTVMRYSSTGTLLATYPFAFNSYNAYGAFMLNGVYHVGLGSAHPTHPNTIVAIGFNSTGAFIQSILPIPQSSYNDLASCTPGKMLALSTSNMSNKNDFEIFPNPFSNSVEINLPTHLDFPVNVELFDVVGKKLFSEKLYSSKTEMFSALPTGTYYLRIGEISIQKLIKIE